MSVALAILVVAIVVCGLLLQRSWTNPVHLEQPVVLEISKGDSLATIAKKLALTGVIRNETTFRWFVQWQSSGSSLKSGEYQFENSLSPQDVLDVLTMGRVTSYSIRLLEGRRFSDYLEQLRDTPNLVDDTHDLDAVNAVARFGIKYQTETAEGYFFPDTYHYSAGDTASSILLRAHEQMDLELQKVWSERSELAKVEFIEDLLIIASLIEKETSWPSDRSRVSGVIHRRLDKRMRLQLDPTVIYALGDEFDGNLTRQHLGLEHTHNTYRNYGLPPSPICSPSQASLVAAAQPADNQELYFVARGDGSSEFSNTLSQHNRAVRKYQR